MKQLIVILVMTTLMQGLVYGQDKFPSLEEFLSAYEKVGEDGIQLEEPMASIRFYKENENLVVYLRDERKGGKLFGFGYFFTNMSIDFKGHHWRGEPWCFVEKRKKDEILNLLKTSVNSINTGAQPRVKLFEEGKTPFTVLFEHAKSKWEKTIDSWYSYAGWDLHISSRVITIESSDEVVLTFYRDRSYRLGNFKKGKEDITLDETDRILTSLLTLKKEDITEVEASPLKEYRKIEAAYEVVKEKWKVEPSSVSGSAFMYTSKQNEYFVIDRTEGGMFFILYIPNKDDLETKYSFMLHKDSLKLPEKHIEAYNTFLKASSE